MITLQERVHSASPPAHWSFNKLHRIFRVRRGQKNTGMQEENLLSLSYGRIIQKDIDAAEGLLPESFETYQIVEPGNIVMRLTDLQNDRRSLRQGLVKERGIITSAYDTLEVGKDHDPRFWAYALLALDLAKYYYSLGGGVRQSIKFADFPNDWIATPNLQTQKAIADFLDRGTARIDQLIEKRSRFIVLSKEKRAAVVDHAVTQGVDPDVEFKESGVDWIGKIPAHWQMVPPTVLFTESKERARDGDQLLSATQKYGVIPLAEFEELEQRQVTLAVANLERRKHVEIGDFVISMRSMDGGLERAHAIGSVRSSYSVLKPGPNVEGRFYGALLKSSLYIQALRLTSNFIRDGQDMNFGHFRKVRLPKLDVQEQAAIADHIESKTSRIDSLLTLTERSINRLRELRAALITAAVTGQIDATTWGKRGTADQRLDEIQEAMRA